MSEQRADEMTDLEFQTHRANVNRQVALYLAQTLEWILPRIDDMEIRKEIETALKSKRDLL